MAEKFKIQGGETLKGEVSIGGAKNSVLKLLAATILVKGVTKIYNVPHLTDVDIMLNVLSDLGAKYVYDKQEKSVVVDASNISRGGRKYLKHFFIKIKPFLIYKICTIDKKWYNIMD